MTKRKMRIPICQEWDELVRVTNGDNDAMHYSEMLTICQNYGPERRQARTHRGYINPTHKLFAPDSDNDMSGGFRPVVQVSASEATLADGDVAVIGTLYMDGKPVHVPKQPVWHGDIADYVDGAKLEMRKPLKNHDYQVHAIKVGNAMIADRIMLKRVSWDDLAQKGVLA